MDGFADGVAHYNKAKSKNVQVLGWDKATQNGTFADDFVDQDEGKKRQRHAGRPGRRRDHAGRRWHRPGHRGRRAGGRRQVLRHLGRRRRLRERRSSTATSFLTTVVKNIPDAVKEAVAQGRQGRGARRDPGLPRHAGEQRCLDRAVPRVRQQGRRRPQGRGRQAQGGHHRRHRQGRRRRPSRSNDPDQRSAAVRRGAPAVQAARAGR